MKKTSKFLLAAVLAAGCVVSAAEAEKKADAPKAAEVSLICNGDFSLLPLSTKRHWGKTKGSQWLEGWIGVADLDRNTLDDKIFVSAPYSMRINSIDPKKGADVRYWSLKTVKPNTRYRISCMIKTENIEGVGGVCVNFVDTANRWFPEKNIKGTNDWKLYSFDYTTKEGTNQGKLPCTLGLRIVAATGTAWFDDVKVVELAPEQK